MGVSTAILQLDADATRTAAEIGKVVSALADVKARIADMESASKKGDQTAVSGLQNQYREYGRLKQQLADAKKVAMDLGAAQMKVAAETTKATSAHERFFSQMGQWNAAEAKANEFSNAIRRWREEMALAGATATRTGQAAAMSLGQQRMAITNIAFAMQDLSATWKMGPGAMIRSVGDNLTMVGSQFSAWASVGIAAASVVAQGVADVYLNTNHQNEALQKQIERWNEVIRLSREYRLGQREGDRRELAERQNAEIQAVSQRIVDQGVQLARARRALRELGPEDMSGPGLRRSIEEIESPAQRTLDAQGHPIPVEQIQSIPVLRGLLRRLEETRDRERGVQSHTDATRILQESGSGDRIRSLMAQFMAGGGDQAGAVARAEQLLRVALPGGPGGPSTGPRGAAHQIAQEVVEQLQMAAGGREGRAMLAQAAPFQAEINIRELEERTRMRAIEIDRMQAGINDRSVVQGNRPAPIELERLQHEQARDEETMRVLRGVEAELERGNRGVVDALNRIQSALLGIGRIWGTPPPAAIPAGPNRPAGNMPLGPALPPGAAPALGRGALRQNEVPLPGGAAVVPLEAMPRAGAGAADALLRRNRPPVFGPPVPIMAPPGPIPPMPVIPPGGEIPLPQALRERLDRIQLGPQPPVVNPPEGPNIPVGGEIPLPPGMRQRLDRIQPGQPRPPVPAGVGMIGGPSGALAAAQFGASAAGVNTFAMRHSGMIAEQFGDVRNASNALNAWQTDAGLRALHPEAREARLSVNLAQFLEMTPEQRATFGVAERWGGVPRPSRADDVAAAAGNRRNAGAWGRMDEMANRFQANAARFGSAPTAAQQSRMARESDILARETARTRRLFGDRGAGGAAAMPADAEPMQAPGPGRDPAEAAMAQARNYARNPGMLDAAINRRAERSVELQDRSEAGGSVGAAAERTAASNDRMLDVLIEIRDAAKEGRQPFLRGANR